MSALMKVGMIFIIACLLAIPLFMLIGLADERKSYKNDVTKEIATNFGKSQTIVSPYLRINYEEYSDYEDELASNESYTYFIPPQTVAVQGDVNVETKYRSIYSTSVYAANFNIVGYFQLTKVQIDKLNAAGVRTNDVAALELRVSDNKGLRGNIEFSINGEKLAFERDRNSDGAIIRVSVPTSLLISGEKLGFALQLPIHGTRAVSFVSTGLENTYDIKGNWPHPKFNGNYLPDSRIVTDAGFEGQWNTSWLAGSIIDKDGNIRTSTASIFSGSLSSYAFGVEFIDTVDIYSLVNRAVKYGMIIILLTFMVIFMFEVLGNLQVHPVQYGLTGVALTVFYLLLLSLSELIPFTISYLLASLACVGLISFYMHFSLKKLKSSIILAFSLLCCYLATFILLNSDYALLLGSVMIFILLAALMMATRRINWFALGANKEEEKK